MAGTDVMSDFDNRSRKLARERYWQVHSKNEYSCPDCGRGQDEIVGEFQVHHKSGNPHDNRLERLIALCGFCHRLREDKKPSLERIEAYRDQEATEPEPERDPVVEKNAEPLIYTAGRMVWHDGEDSSYRASIEQVDPVRKPVWETEGFNCEFLHPHHAFLDHGGEVIGGCVAEDIEMINQADGLVALFDETGQTGTMTELFHAVSQDMPTLVLFSTKLIRRAEASDWSSMGSIEHEPKPLGGVVRRGQSPLWFLINYLTGDSTRGREKTQTPRSTTCDPYATPSPPRAEWQGTDSAVAIVRTGDGSIKRAIKSWVDKDLTEVNFQLPEARATDD